MSHVGPASPQLRRLVGLAAAIAFACARPAAAQTVTAPALKAAFLYNFAKFADWPAEVAPATGAITLCVLGDAPVAEALDQTVRGHNINGHEVIVSAVTIDGSLRSCHLLYVSRLNAQRTVQLLDTLAGAPVFTVSDLDRFAQLGGVAHLFLETDKMRFAINLEAAQRAHLRISSKLLALATIVKDDRYARQD